MFVPGWVIPLLVAIALASTVLIPCFGVAVARMTGPLTWSRGLIGAVAASVACDVLAITLAWAYDPAALGHALIGRAGMLPILLGVSAWIVEALVVGAICIALWPGPKHDGGSRDPAQTTETARGTDA